MTREEFIEKFVTITMHEDEEPNLFGHYPFQLYAVTKEDKVEINGLLLAGDVAACYQRFQHYYQSGAKEIFMTLDFPPIEDITTDFVAIFSYQDAKFNVCAIPYDPINGERERVISLSERNALFSLMKNFHQFVK